MITREKSSALCPRRSKQADEQRRKRDDTAEVYASFASEKVKKMPAVKNGFKIEI